MDSYGMHTDFDKACSIAGITDAAVKCNRNNRQMKAGKLKALLSLQVQTLRVLQLRYNFKNISRLTDTMPLKFLGEGFFFFFESPQ